MAKEFLYHHGILGQKWGVRRFQNEDGSYTEEGKRRRRDDNYSEDYRRYRDLKSKPSSHLSTKELEEINRRQNAEDQFNKRKYGAGKQFVDKLGSKLLEKTAEAVATIIVVKIGQRWVEQRLGL